LAEGRSLVTVRSSPARTSDRFACGEANQVVGIIPWLCVVVVVSGCSLPRSQFAWQLAGTLHRLGEQRPDPDPSPLVLERLDVYRPPQGLPTAAIMAVPGAAVGGKDDARLVAFARALVRSGMIVVVPDLVGLKSLQVGPRDIKDIAASFQTLFEHPGLVPDGRAGIFAFSYAAGPALLAALEPDIRDKVRFLVLVGGYYDAERVLRFTTTGAHGYRGRMEQLAPHEYGRLVLVLSAADLLPPVDRVLFTEIVKLKFADPEADLHPLAEGLGPEARALYELLINEDPARFSALVARLNPRFRSRWQELSPSAYDLSALKARVYLVHGRWDPAIPYTESLSLRDALRTHAPVRLAILDTLHHVDLGARSRHPLSQLFDGWKLWWMLYHLGKEARL